MKYEIKIANPEAENTIDALGISRERAEEMSAIVPQVTKEHIFEGKGADLCLSEIVENCQSLEEVAFFCFTFSSLINAVKQKLS